VVDQPVVVVGIGSFWDPAGVVDAFRGRATVRYEAIDAPRLVAAATADADAIVVASQPLTATLIDALGSGVVVIGRTGVGTVDLDAARQAGITVFNEPSYGELEVASHAIAMLLALQRKFPLADAYVRNGWRGVPNLRPVLPIDELRVGIIGCGRIGRMTVERLQHLVHEVLVYDPLALDVPPGARRVAELDEMLPQCHGIILHLPLTEQQEGLSVAVSWRYCRRAQLW
jgi:D-3-phosphoglycerate dehydrogenase